MTLPTSGPLTLSDIQTEFGGSNPISLSEYYAGGGLVPPGTTGTNGAVPSSGTISISNFYGTSNIADTQTVTVGIFSTAGGFGTGYGFLSGSGGSISDGTFNPKGGAAINGLYFSTVSGFTSLVFSLGSSQTNDGWTTMTVSGVSYDRASASYTSGNPTSWTWSGGANPFGTTVGATVVATFT
jgi:hypothetical protein